ncbi:hypothetical protein N8388_04580 [Octadecabacter sp.]|nr:hypothetical protein [Octadecabacter sp.]
MAGYIGSKAAVVSSGAERKKTFDITTSTTSLTGLNYTVGQVHVFHNGVRLVDGTDYTATNSTSITLTAAAENGDQVVVISYASFQVADAYTQAEADAEFVAKSGDTMTGDLDVTGTVTANQFVGGGAIILVGDQSDDTNYTTTSISFQTASRFQITPSSSTSQLLGWLFCQMRATGGASDGDMGNVARVHYLDSSSSWVAASNLVANYRLENGTSTGLQEISATFPILLTQDQLNASGVWDVAIRHYENYDATSAIDDGKLHYMEYEP